MTASLQCAAGATWVRVSTTSAWAARLRFTSVIDGTGTIYVLGGDGNSKKLNDVWRSTDKGEARHATGASSVMIVLRGEWS